MKNAVLLGLSLILTPPMAALAQSAAKDCAVVLSRPSGIEHIYSQNTHEFAALPEFVALEDLRDISPDGKVQLINREVLVFAAKGHRIGVHSRGSFTQDSKAYVFQQGDSLKVFDFASQKVTHDYKIPQSRKFQYALSEDLFVFKNSSATWDVNNGLGDTSVEVMNSSFASIDVLPPSHLRGSAKVMLSPDHQFIVSISANNVRIHKWDDGSLVFDSLDPRHKDSMMSSFDQVSFTEKGQLLLLQYGPMTSANIIDLNKATVAYSRAYLPKGTLIRSSTNVVAPNPSVTFFISTSDSGLTSQQVTWHQPMDEANSQFQYQYLGQRFIVISRHGMIYTVLDTRKGSVAIMQDLRDAGIVTQLHEYGNF